MLRKTLIVLAFLIAVALGVAGYYLFRSPVRVTDQRAEEFLPPEHSVTEIRVDGYGDRGGQVIKNREDIGRVLHVLGKAHWTEIRRTPQWKGIPFGTMTIVAGDGSSVHLEWSSSSHIEYDPNWKPRPRGAAGFSTTNGQLFLGLNVPELHSILNEISRKKGIPGKWPESWGP